MENTDNRIGKKIRQFRILEGYTQKELADKCGLSESAIRNYELGIRVPDNETINLIAEALIINPYELSNYDMENADSVIHALFELESLYGIYPEEIDGDIVIRFSSSEETEYLKDTESVERLKSHLFNWAKMRAVLSKDSSGATDYFVWRTTYPKSENDKPGHRDDVRLNNQLVKSAYKNKKDNSQNDQDELYLKIHSLKNTMKSIPPELERIYKEYKNHSDKKS